MLSKIHITRKDLEEILKIIDEVNIEGSIELIYDNSSGIGYTIDIEFDHNINDRYIRARTPIATSDNW
jgi:hypothetical protein